MRPLITGILLFLIWSSLSTWYYVCFANDYCDGPEVTQQVTPEEAEPEIDTTQALKEEILPLPGDLVIQFAYNGSLFTPDPFVENFLTECKVYLDKEEEATVIITGHACSIGPSGYNMELGVRRAESVSSYLIKNGFPANRIQTFSKGENEPVADNATNAGREKNRRSEITVKN